MARTAPQIPIQHNSQDLQTYWG